METGLTYEKILDLFKKSDERFEERLNKEAEKRNKEADVAPIDYWRKALENVTPSVEVKSRRIGGATFQVPMEVRSDKKLTMAMKFVIEYARKRSGKKMSERLADEIMAAYKEEGGAFKKKEDMHRMAEANKAFSHFRF